MIGFEISALIQAILDAPATVYSCPAVSVATPVVTPTGYVCGNCGGSAFTPIAAAFGTIGYWAQAGWLHQIYNHGLSHVIMLAYILSAITGIVTFVLGASPKQYIWLFVGPALFYWLTEYRTGVSGVAWMVGGSPRDQREVWRMTETGLLNEDYVQRFGFSVSSFDAPIYGGPGSGAIATGESLPCGDTDGACVSNFFGFFDQVVSDTVQYLIGFIGAGRKMYSQGGSGTNVIQGASGTQIYHADLMNNLRWSFFGSISEARINNPDLRRAFATFMSNECGDQFLSAIQQDKLYAIKKRQESALGTTILDAEVATAWTGLYTNAEYPVEIKLWSKLNAIVPTPKELKTLITHKGPIVGTPGVGVPGVFVPPPPALEKNTAGLESNVLYVADLMRTTPLKARIMNWQFTTSFPFFFPVLDAYSPVPAIDEMVSCKTFLMLLMQGLRWEAAHTAYQIMTGGPDELLPLDYSASMLYGMDIKYPPTLGTLPTLPGATFGDQLTYQHIPQFIESLVLAKIFANELQVTPAVAAQTESQYSVSVADKNIQDVKQFQRVNNQFSKFGELYTWAEMVPYFQGQLLYYLAIAYPFAAMFVVIPGMFKGFIQWCQFWVWVKLWDLGFAMVTVLERSVWSITGGGSKNGEYNTLILQIAGVNGANGTSICEASGAGIGLTGISKATLIPHVAVDPFYNPASIPIIGSGPGHPEGVYYMQYMLDRLLAASGDIGLNMANTYYIYIMSALYLSVPVICGTLVLGAKSGMASMLGSTMGGISSPAGGAASQAAVGNYSKALGSNTSTFGQEAFAKSLRSGSAAGFAKSALDAQNMSTGEQMAGTFVGTKSQAMGMLSSVMGSEMSGSYLNYQAAMQPIQAAAQMMDGMGTGLGRLNGSNLQTATGQTPGSNAAGIPGGPPGLMPGGGNPALMPGGGASALPRSSTSGATLGSGGGGADSGGGIAGVAGATAMRLMSSAAGYNNISGMRYMAQGKMAEMAKLSGAQAGLNVASAGHQSAGALAGLRGQRQNEAADFAGREGQWYAQDNVAQSAMASEVAAITGSAGMLSPGQKPQSASAMAYMGRFEGGRIGAGGGFTAFGGHGSMASARAANRGGSLDQQRSSGLSDLNKNYGSAYVMSGAKGGSIDSDKNVREACFQRAMAQTNPGVMGVVAAASQEVIGGLNRIGGGAVEGMGELTKGFAQMAIDSGNKAGGEKIMQMSKAVEESGKHSSIKPGMGGWNTDPMTPDKNGNTVADKGLAEGNAAANNATNPRK